MVMIAEHLPIQEIWVITWSYALLTVRPHHRLTNVQSKHFLASLGAQENWCCIHIAHQCCDHLTAVKQGIRWPVSPDRIAGAGVHPSSSSIFEVIRWQVTSFQTIAGSSLVLLNSWHILCLCAAQLKFFISNWPRTRKFSQLLQAGKTVAFDFPHHGHALITLCAAGLKCRSQVTAHGSDHRPQVRSLVRSQVTHKNYRTLDKTVLDWHFIIQN